MNEAKAAKQAMAMLVKQDVIRLVEDYEEKIANLAQKHSINVEYVKRLITTASDLRRKRAPGRVQALVHIKAQEVNACKSFLIILLSTSFSLLNSPSGWEQAEGPCSSQASRPRSRTTFNLRRKT